MRVLADEALGAILRLLCADGDSDGDAAHN
jgi:hypothetical protein